MAEQVGARFLAEWDIWMAGERAAHRGDAEVEGGGAVAPLAETALLHMPGPLRMRFRGWWRSLPSLSAERGGRDGS